MSERQRMISTGPVTIFTRMQEISLQIAHVRYSPALHERIRSEWYHLLKNILVGLTRSTHW